MLKFLSAHADLNHVSERALHARAKGILLDSVQDKYHAFIINDDQVCDMFKYLKQYNIDDNPQSSIVNERTKLKSFQLSVSNVTSFLSQARTSYNKLSALGSPMSDQDYFITLIHHIPAEYNFIRAQLIGTRIWVRIQGPVLDPTSIRQPGSYFYSRAQDLHGTNVPLYVLQQDRISRRSFQRPISTLRTCIKACGIFLSKFFI